MNPKGYEGIITDKKNKILLFLTYLLIIVVLYALFIFTGWNNAVGWVKSDMQKKLDTFLLSIDADFNKKSWFGMSLVENNSVYRPLYFNMGGQVKEYLQGNSTLLKGEYKIIVTDRKNEIVFNNADNFNSLESIKVNDSQYSGFVYDGRIFYINYVPINYTDVIKRDNVTRLGSVISAYDFLDFYKLVPKSEDGLSYVYYGFAENTLCFKIDKNPAHENSVVNKNSLHKFKEGYTHLKIDGKNNLVLLKNIDLLNSTEPFIISIAIPEGQLWGVEAGYILRSILYSTIAAVLITAVMLLLYYQLRKSFINRLEITNLRTQRHDFSKHLGVLQGMAVLGEYDELGKYLDSLCNKVSFEGEVFRMGCPPLSVLILEKEAAARENGIDYKVHIEQDIEGIGVSPDDLCVVIGNIIDNAVEATADIDAACKSMCIEIGNKEGYYYFRVSNSGRTIPESQIQNIFRPGYTTKKNGKGRGMGLYIVSRTLRKYHGSVQVDSGEGVTTFTVYIPEKK